MHTALHPVPIMHMLTVIWMYQGFGILAKDILKCELEEPGIKPPTFQLVSNPVHLPWFDGLIISESNLSQDQTLSVLYSPSFLVHLAGYCLDNLATECVMSAECLLHLSSQLEYF